MNRKSQKFGQPNNATQWKARGFIKSSTSESAASHVDQLQITDQQDSFGFRPEDVDRQISKRPAKDKQSKPKKKFKQNESAQSNDTPEKPKPIKSVQKKKKPVEEGEQPDGEEAAEEKTNPKRKKQKFQGYTLFIGNLSYDTTKEDILNHFSKCGPIKNVRIPIDKGTNQPRGFGYIEVEEHVTYEVSLLKYIGQG